MFAFRSGWARYRASEVNDVVAGRWRRLWAIRSGREQPEDLSGNFKVQLGRWTEAFNLRWLAETRGAACGPLDGTSARLPPDAELRHHPDGGAYARRGRYSARPDGIGADGRGAYLVEAKHVGDRMVPDQVVRRYLGQLFVSMHVLGMERAVLSVIYGSERQTAYGVTWSEPTWRAIEGWIDAFDGHLLLDVEPVDPLEPPWLTLPLPPITNRWRPEGRPPYEAPPAEMKADPCFSA